MGLGHVLRAYIVRRNVSLCLSFVRHLQCYSATQQLRVRVGVENITAALDPLMAASRSYTKCQTNYLIGVKG